MNSILILGAGLMQKPAIQAAKNLGLKVYVVDANPNALCVQDADEFCKIDLKDKEKIASYAHSLKQSAGLKSVFTAGTDFSTSVSYACEKCSFPSHSFKAAQNASNKALMRKCFLRDNVPSPKFMEFSERDINNLLLDKIVSNFKFPCVVKPVDNMGARGCRMVCNTNEVIPAINDAIKNSRSKTAILEDYMDGKEFSIDALVYNGTMTITGFADRHIYYPPYFIEIGHTMPTQIQTAQYNELVRTFALGVASLGLTQGAAKADIKLTSSGAMIGEIAARLSGGYMSGWTFPYSSGLNLTEQAILISLGEVPHALEQSRVELNISSPFKLYEYKSTKTSAERAWISIPGTIKKVLGLNEAKSTKNIKDVLPRASLGDTVVFPKNNVEKCGNVISVSESYKDAVDAAENAVKNITLVLQKNNYATDEFLKSGEYACLLDAKNSNTTGNTTLTSFNNATGNTTPSAFTLQPSDLKNLKTELEQCQKCNKIIPQGAPISKYIPNALIAEKIMSLIGFNHLTLKETIEKFDTLCSNHKELNFTNFWCKLLRGGIQGALYEAE